MVMKQVMGLENRGSLLNQADGMRMSYRDRLLMCALDSVEGDILAQDDLRWTLPLK